MTQHTPGPWFHSCDEGHASYCNVNAVPDSEPDGLVIATLEEVDDGTHTEEREANARLIAAAPDLLQAAELALGVAESWIHDQLDGTRQLDTALADLEPARAAIALARGQEVAR